MNRNRAFYTIPFRVAACAGLLLFQFAPLIHLGQVGAQRAERACESHQHENESTAARLATSDSGQGQRLNGCGHSHQNHNPLTCPVCQILALGHHIDVPLFFDGSMDLATHEDVVPHAACDAAPRIAFQVPLARGPPTTPVL